MFHSNKSRLMSSTALISYIFVLLCICPNGLSEEDINRNVISDQVELGNTYSLPNSNSRMATKRKHASHVRRAELPDVHVHIPQVVSESDEAEPHLSVNNAISGDTPIVNNHHSRHRNHGNHHDINSGEQPAAPCPTCATAQHNNKVMATLDEETQIAYRVELVKQQILKKLRLKEPPKMPESLVVQHAISEIALGNHLPSHHGRKDEDDISNMDMEDFYGKTEQIIVLPQDDITQCGPLSSGDEVSSCFVFNLPKEVRSKQISGATLWYYHYTDKVGASNSQTIHSKNSFSVGEVLFNHRDRKSHGQVHRIASEEDIPDSANWINFNITETARKWLVTEVHEHKLKVQCTTCIKDSSERDFGQTPEEQPFIVFNIAKERKHRRHRRSLNCTPGVTECCRESLVISFKDIKWDWVISPASFDAHYCKGSCHGIASFGRAVDRHSRIMMNYVAHKGGVSNSTAELIPCCTATEMEPLQMLVYMGESSDNSTAIQNVIIPNMVVKSCGCK